MSTHNICFEQKYENSQKISTENCHFYSHEKSLYIAWTCFRNAVSGHGWDSAEVKTRQLQGPGILMTDPLPWEIDTKLN